jgi:valyl-tRNA synthetase
VTIDQVLRLLHPFVPFLTEALWEPLHAQAAVRGIETPLPLATLLIQAAWPSPNPNWHDPAVEARMAFLQEVIRAIRDIRSHYTIPPQAKVKACIRAADDAAITLRASAELLSTMASLESVEVAPKITRSPDAAMAVAGPVEVYIPGVIDVAKERARLTKQRDQLLARMALARRKLANEDFLRKASPAVVQKERDRLVEFETQMDNVEANLAALE